MDWDQLKYFLYIAKSGSLSRAAKALHVNHSTVSRRLANLEKSLGARLFEKSHDGVKLTSSGEQLLEHALQMESQANAAQQAIAGHGETLCGTIRVTTEDTFGYYFLPDLLAKFSRQYPHIVVNLNISSEFANLSHREADVAITARRKPPEHLVGRNLGEIRMSLVASKKYVKKFGTPSDLRNLKNHRFLVPNDQLGHLKVTRWLNKHVHEDQIVLMADKFSTLFTMVQTGLGIAPLPHYLAASDKKLVCLFDLPSQYGSEAWVLTHPNLKNTLTIKTFIKYIGDHLKL